MLPDMADVGPNLARFAADALNNYEGNIFPDLIVELSRNVCPKHNAAERNIFTQYCISRRRLRRPSGE